MSDEPRVDAPAWLRGGLELVGWTAVIHLLLAKAKPLVIPLFLLSGALLIATGQTDEDGAVAVGPGALDDGYRDVVDPALFPAALAAALAFVALFGGHGLSYAISRDLAPGPGTGRRLNRLLTGGVGYRERWHYTKAVNGLRLLRATTAQAVAAVEHTHAGLGRRVVRVGGWVKWTAWTAFGVGLVVLWATGVQTSFRWQ